MGQREQNQRPPGRANPLAPGVLGLPDGLIEDVSQVAESLDHLNNLGVNLLAPLTRIEFLPAGYQMAFRVVLFPMDGEWVNIGGKRTNGTWYETDGGGLALHKVALRQLAAAAGLSWETFDTSKDVNRWIMKAIGRLRNMDGQWRQVSAIKDLDLRDTGPVVPAWHDQARRKNGRDANADRRIMKAREYGGRMAESKAVNAMIRDALGLRTNYSAAMARAPFVFPLLVWTPTSPEALKLQAAVELGVVSQVFGPASTGKVYAEAGTVIEAETVTPGPARRQLPAPDPHARDLEAEAEAYHRRQGQRQPVERQRQEPPPYGRQAARPTGPSPQDAEAYRVARGWDAPANDEQRRQLLTYVSGKGSGDFDRFLRDRSQSLGSDSPDW